MVIQSENFLTEEECSLLIEMIEERKQPSKVAEGWNSTNSQWRTSYSTPLYFDNNIIHNIKQKIADYLQIPIEHGEPLEGQVYEEGQYFKPHHDYFTDDSYIRHCQHSGNRVFTVMLYLNDVEEGGETNFPEMGIVVKPQRGKLISWRNMEEMKVLPNSLHEGVPPTKGKKYIITSWWREKPFNYDEDKRLFEEYQAKGYKTSKLVSKGYFLLPMPNLVKDTIKDINTLVEVVPPHTIHQVPSLANLLLNSVYQSVKMVYNEEIDIFKLGEFKRYYKGDNIPLVETPNFSNIISVLLIVSNNPSTNKPWPFSIKYNGKFEKIYPEENTMLVYVSGESKVSMLEPLEGSKFITLDMHYRMKL